MSTIMHPLNSIALMVTLVVAALLSAPVAAQSYPAFDLSEIWPATSNSPGTAVTGFSSFVPGTSIPITVSTSEPVFRDPDGFSGPNGSAPPGALRWDAGADSENNWTITVGAPSNDVEITLHDFDRFTLDGGATLSFESLSQLDATLGAPSLVTTGAPGDAQMIYQAGEVGGRIIHGSTFPENVDAGTAVALWEDANLSTITFTTTASTPLVNAINVRLGAVPIPEPSTCALVAIGLCGLAAARRRRSRS